MAIDVAWYTYLIFKILTLKISILQVNMSTILLITSFFFSVHSTMLALLFLFKPHYILSRTDLSLGNGMAWETYNPLAFRGGVLDKVLHGFRNS